jgi:hypothetical protein
VCFSLRRNAIAQLLFIVDSFCPGGRGLAAPPPG